MVFEVVNDGTLFNFNMIVLHIPGLWEHYDTTAALELQLFCEDSYICTKIGYPTTQLQLEFALLCAHWLSFFGNDV